MSLRISIGKRDDAFQQATSLLAAYSIELIYGGGNCGLLGVLAHEVLKGGRGVTGVIPRGLLTKNLATFN